MIPKFTSLSKFQLVKQKDIKVGVPLKILKNTLYPGMMIFISSYILINSYKFREILSSQTGLVDENFN